MSEKQALEVERLQLKYHIKAGRLKSEITKAHIKLLSMDMPRS